MVTLESWGRLIHEPHQLITLQSARAAAQIRNFQPGICFGNGRSYGDVCLNPGGTVWLTRRMDRLLAFDEEQGILRCQSGVLLQDIQRTLLPRGWMLPVTPGTQLITVGGAIANDVHGKNHHRLGSFGDHVRGFTLLRSDGSTTYCSASDPADNGHNLFRATIGGLGLTGVIVEATLQLRRVESGWLDTETIPYQSLNEFFDLADSSEQDWEHTVSWIDCLSGSNGSDVRGIFLRANHSQARNSKAPAVSKRQPSIPFTPPLSLVNRLSLRPFNTLYYHVQARKKGPGRAWYESFNYPLDSLLNWNRMYGPRGFYQYQCVLPTATSRDGIAKLLDTIRASGDGSFLAVLKTFGQREAPGLLSFPMPGATLALDFPNMGSRTLQLFERLDAIVRDCQGRLYAAKDARMPAELFHAGYPQLHNFLPYRDPGVSSALSRRLFGN
ncbi:MAG TPA: FAD-binding oxidoreductase [Pseudohongiella sp.]|nr:FAD-binding oxidoreductase [Pseudohongiella sp.]